MTRAFRMENNKKLLVGVISAAFILSALYNNIFQFDPDMLVIKTLTDSSLDQTVAKQIYLTRQAIKKLQENSCKIPILNPFAPVMTNFFRPETETCSDKNFYFRSHVHENLLSNQSIPMIISDIKTPSNLYCCYEQLQFSKTYNYKRQIKNTDKCVFLKGNQTEVPNNTEYLVVNCWDKQIPQLMKKSSIFNLQLEKYPPSHQELLFFVPKPSPKLLKVKQKQLKLHQQNNNEPLLNVIILGFDKVSRANLIRLMPKTFAYLKVNLNAIDLQGFNKMGDATLNNTLAMLTGHDFAEVQKNKWYTDEHQFFDDCPWIWKNFSEKGYITAYADDYTSVFNYRFKGFKKQPTDYYMEPFSEWYNDGKKKRWNKFGSGDCIGNELGLNLLSDHARKMSAALKSHPYFHFTWNSRIHERPGYPSLADKGTLETLQYFETTGILNKSLVILVSDHGWRAGTIMMNLQARIENRQSFAFLLLPQWFRKRYKNAYENLRENQYRLTSPYDIYETLKAILSPNELTSKQGGKRVVSDDDRKGVSLFTPISKNRTCAEAGIDEEWCACTTYDPFPVDSPKSKKLAEFAVKTLNSWLRPFTGCKQYSLNSVISVEVKRSFETRDRQQFRVIFSVRPWLVGGAQFEVIVFVEEEYWHNGNSSLISMSTEVFRLNSYYSADCMPNYSLKKICTC